MGKSIKVTTELEWYNAGKIKYENGKEEIFVVKKGEIKEVPEMTDQIAYAISAGFLKEVKEDKKDNKKEGKKKK